MKYFSFFLFASLFLASTGSAQSTLGASGGSSGSRDYRRMDRSLPDLPPRTHGKLPPGLKGALPESVSWDSKIAAPGNNPDGMTVTCFAEDSDNLYIGGDFLAFDTVSTYFIAHSNRKTGVWDAPDYGTGNEVLSLALHNGDLYAAGAFSTAGSSSLTVNYIAEWDGTAWQSLGGGMNAEVSSIAFVGDTLYAGGSFTQAGGNPASFLAYWDGQNWYEAAKGTSYPVSALFATHDSLFVGGTFNYVGSETSNTGQHARGCAMLQNGTWTTFGTGFYASTFAIYNGELWAGGNYYGLGDRATIVYNIAVWNGSAWNPVMSDTSIGTEGTGAVNQLLVVGDTLLALGGFSQMAGVSANGIAMLHNGTWSPLAGGLYGQGYSAIPFNGELYVGGRFTKAGSVNAEALATLSQGNWSPVVRMVSQNVGWASAEVRAIATTERYVFIGGSFTTIAGQTCNHIADWDKKLKSWSPLGPGVDGDVYSLAVQGNELIVGGSFNNAGTIAARHIATCNITSKLWSPMGGGAVRNVGAIAVSNGLVYAPIYNPLTNGSFYDYLCAWDGTSWTPFGNGLDAGYIEALAWQGSTLFAAGTFTVTDDGTVVDYVAQLQADYWGSLNSGLNSDAYALAVSGDSLYVGCVFTQADGQLDSALAVWGGANWDPIGVVGFNRGVYALAADATGGVYAGGEFTTVAGVGRGHLVHWNGKAFGTVSSGVDNTVSALATDSGALYAGGWFGTVGSGKVPSLHFAALDGAGVDAVSPSIPANNPAESVYPNPVVNASTLDITLSESGPIKLELFNSFGERVSLLADGPYAQGNQNFILNGKDLPDGLYFLRLSADGGVTTQRLAIEK